MAPSAQDEVQLQTKNIDQNVHRLDLESDGHLRINGKEKTDLLDGLIPSIWTATRPAFSENSIFLHMRHSPQWSQHEMPVGDLISCNRLLACSRLTRYWMGPAFGTSAKDVPLDTQFLLVEVSENGPYALLLPLVDSGFRASLHYSDNKIDIVCHAESGDENVKLDSSGMRALYVSVSNDPFELLKKGFVHVSEETGTFSTLDQKTLPETVDEFGWCTWDAFYSKVTPQGILDGVASLQAEGVPPRTLILDDGWQQVTPSPPDWKTESKNTSINARSNAVVSRVANLMFDSLSKVVSAFYERFVRTAKHGTVGNRIWYYLAQTVLKGQLENYFHAETDFGRQLSGFTPNFKFHSAEGELKDLVSTLKDQLGVKRVYCWHALHGYWRGVSSELGQSVGINVTQVQTNPSNHLLQIEPQLAWDTVSLFGVGLLSNPSDLTIFYKHLHSPLVEAGIDGVKVDVQSGVSALGSGVGGGPHLARIYTEAMEASVSERFSSEDGAANCINCMCHSTENIYRYKVTSVARASDDFYPHRPESHTVHLVNVAYNSLFMGEICLPDWDMFHSKHESAHLHAAARAIGGCPIYVSDEPGKHDVTLLKRLVLSDGSVLRAKLPGRPTRDCLFSDVGKDGTSALKIWNQNSYGGVVGAFHVQGVAWNFVTNENEVVDAAPVPLTANVKPHDVESLRDITGPFAIWRHRSSALEVLPDGNTLTTTSLSHSEWEVFTIVPIQNSDNNDVAWGPIGLVDMLNSGGAIQQAGELEKVVVSGEEEDSPTTSTQFISRGPGRFVSYCQPAPSRVLIRYGDGNSVGDLLFSHDAPSGELSFILPEEKGGAHSVTVLW
eukprot:CAMPEP_0195514416 /NCGR_PEP_ID=MMETSP0794_2-20130614/5810_1 /TAXON_ID=515487 /ORGANISM="Stephanopyxis turris, Strain CCMP 815" /LENGTH=837 /DNA_ID=CAMNT_0040642659 /DNA_START=337 /DNA_END=2847 /DNA_ORIENTATION=+